MGVVIETEVWAPHPLSYALLFAACLAALVLLPYFSSSPPSSTAAAATAAAAAAGGLDLGATGSFLRFRRSFLLLFSLASVIEGIQSVFGEDEFVQCGLGRDQMAASLAGGAAAALLLGTFSGVLSDVKGPKKVCLFYCILHFAVGAFRGLTWLRCGWISSFVLAVASSMFSFCFETWMVIEHEKQGQKQDLLFDTFWVMTFLESVSLVGGQGVTNLLVKNDNTGFLLPYCCAALLAIFGFFFIKKGWNSNHPTSVIGSYTKSFSAHVLRDKRVLILVLAQASIHFSLSAFWFLWAPTIVADGRVVQLSLIYPCFLGSRMLGSAGFPWFYGATAPLDNEDSLTAAYIVAGLAMLIVAYDYQEIGTLVILFCIFHACVGFILPSLARLRTMYLPNELRGGMMSFSLAPANAAIFILLLQGGHHRSVANSYILGLAACGLLTAAGCIHMLRRWRKHSRQNTHNL